MYINNNIQEIIYNNNIQEIIYKKLQYILSLNRIIIMQIKLSRYETTFVSSFEWNDYKKI